MVRARETPSVGQLGVTLRRKARFPFHNPGSAANGATNLLGITTDGVFPINPAPTAKACFLSLLAETGAVL